MIRAVALCLALTFGASIAAAASGTPEEQAACRPDVIKMCKEAGGAEFVVLACLKENRAKLSKACRKVLEDHGQ